MSSDNAKRLREILGREKAAQERLAHERKEREQHQRKEAEVKAATIAKWKEMVPQLAALMKELNEQLQGNGLTLVRTERTGLQRTQITGETWTLKREGQSGNHPQIEVSVWDDGTVRTAFDTRLKDPRSSKDFNLADATKDTFETLIVDFLDQTIGR